MPTTVGRIMTSDVVSVTPDTSFKEIARLLDTHDISGVPVVDDDDKVVGVVSATDLMMRQAQPGLAQQPPRRLWRQCARHTHSVKAAARTAAELMSVPPITVRAQEPVTRAARIMAGQRVERLPVLDEEDRLVGMITRRDILKVFLRPDEDIRQDVIKDVLVGTLFLGPRDVGVRVEDGVVTLEGQLDRATEVLIARRTTARIDGVVGVVDRLTARSDDRGMPPVSAVMRGR